MDFNQKVESIPTFPVLAPGPKSKFVRNHGYLLIQSLFQRELPGEDMVRHANMFLERDMIDVVKNGSILFTCITTQTNCQYSVDFIKCYISPPFYTDNKKKHVKLDLETCRKLRVPYNLGVWVDLEFRVKTYTNVPPLRNYRRKKESKCFFAPCLYLDANSSDPRTSVSGFVCRRSAKKEDSSNIYNERLELVFEPNVLMDFHEDQKNRQNANSSNVVDAATYTRQLWSTYVQKFDRKVWSHRNSKSSDFHLLHKNIVMIGEYDVTTRIFHVKHMGKKSILRGKVVHTKPPYIEQHESLFENERVEFIPNVLLLQFPCMVGSSICYTRRNTTKPVRYDSSVMHAGTCERVVMRNIDYRTDVCNVKVLADGVYEGVLRSTHAIRNTLRSTSATSVFVTPSTIYVVLPFLTTDSDKSLNIHIVEFVKLLYDLPKTETGHPPSECTTMDELLDILTGYIYTKNQDYDIREALRNILIYDPRTSQLLSESRYVILKRLGSLGSRQVSKAKQMKAIEHTIHNECLPHLGIYGTVASKRFKLFHVVKDILLPTMNVVMKRSPPTNIHSLRSKEVNGYSNIIGIMFRQSFARFRKMQMKALYQKTKGNVVIDSTIIHSMFDRQRKFENIVYYGFNTGNVQPSQKKKGNMAKSEKTPQPAVETILAVNTEGKIGTIRRFHIAYAKKNYSAAQRLLHPSQWHYVCPAEVPEGERCGLVMNFSLGVRTSVGYMKLEEALQVCDIVIGQAPGCKIAKCVDDLPNIVSGQIDSLLYINHVMVGRLNISILKELLDELKNARRYAMFHYEVSIYVVGQDIMIETTRGRLLRPLICSEFLDNGIFDRVFQECIQTNIPLWDTMENKHIIEFYSPHELEDDICPIVAAEDAESYYANPGIYTHVEVDKLFMYSNMAANSTLQGQNACVRTSYACKHRSQAASARPLYSESAPENTKLELDYPQTPLVESVTNRMTEHTIQVEAMTECVMAFMNNELTSEDGIIVNKAFLERGGMRITKTQDYHAQAKAHHFIKIPPRNTMGIKAANYSKLDPDTGIVKVGTKVEFNDVLVGIVLQDTKSSVPTFSDKSIVYSKRVPGMVTKVESMKTRYGIESYTITVQLIGVSQVQVGDKLASPYSQKSVVVAILPEAEMPRVMYGPNAGMTVDLIFGNHGLPTRMTGGSSDAPLYGMYAAKFGKRVNGTAFQIRNEESSEEFIRRIGGDGKVWMMNPRTGKKYPEKIFVGIGSYMRLNHLVAEKCHARNGGPVDNYNQPKPGKANKGGQRIGSMEKKGIEGHGASEFLYERMFVSSDKSIAYICERCSSISGEPPLKGQTKGLCRECNDPSSCRMVEIPYSTIVYLHYMKAAGMPISLKLSLDEDNVDMEDDNEYSDWTESEDEWV
jgi:DNA-directed RNA polymerase beta subunit